MDRRDLTEAQTQEAMQARKGRRGGGRRRKARAPPHASPPSPCQALLAGADPAQIGAFLVLLRAKGETGAEVAGLARAMLASGVRVDAGAGLLDIVGTGGDGIGSVNISTGATVIAAAAGAKVAKHGNRSVSSLCGSADVVEALGVSLELGPAGINACLRDASIAFMYAPTFHPAMAAVAPVRRALRVRTAFNLLGPLLNPARAQFALVGVYSLSIAPLMASALSRLGVERALVVHSAGMDELTPLAPALVIEAVAGVAGKPYELDPKRLGIPACTVEDLKGGDAALNATILRDVFGGARSAVADALNLNAGVALAAAGLAATPEDGVALAQETQRAGKAGGVLDAWVQASTAAAAAGAGGA